MVQTGVNETGKAGHHERNKVAGEGAVSASGSETTSAGGASGSKSSVVPSPPETDLDGPTDPSMRGSAARPDRESSSFAPGGDKTSNPDVNAAAMLDQAVGRDATGRQ